MLFLRPVVQSGPSWTHRILNDKGQCITYGPRNFSKCHQAGREAFPGSGSGLDISTNVGGEERLAQDLKKRREELNEWEFQMIAVRIKETKPKRCKNVDQTLVCRYNDCEFVARSKTGLIHHERAHRDKPTFTCSKCERTFGTKSSHTNHVKSCQSGGRVVKVGLPKVPCHICGYIGTKTNLSRHKKAVHGV